MQDLGPTPPQSPWLDVRAAAVYSRKSRNTILSALQAGELRGSQTKTGGKWSIHRDAVDAWLRGEIADIQPAAVTRSKPRTVHTAAS